MKELPHKVSEHTANLPLPRRRRSQQELLDEAQLPHAHFCLSLLPLTCLFKRGKFIPNMRQESTFLSQRTGELLHLEGSREELGETHGAMWMLILYRSQCSLTSRLESLVRNTATCGRNT